MVPNSNGPANKQNPIRGRVTKAQLAEHEYREKEYAAREAKLAELEMNVKAPRYVGGSDVDLEPSDARITNQLRFMAEQIAELSGLLYELEERVSPILLPAFAQPSDPDVPGQATSEISRIIDDHNGSLSELQRRVRQINIRVQL